MGAFEFDSKADLSARSCNFCGNGSNESNGRNEETCYQAKFGNFTEEEIRQYTLLARKVRENERSILQRIWPFPQNFNAGQV